MTGSFELQLALPAGAAPLGSIDAYIQAVGRVPMLMPGEELALAGRFRNTNDLEAARRLVLSHLRFVVKVARGYLGYGLPFSDLIQDGNIGLMKAVKRFDPTVGVRLVSFAVHWIKAEIHEFILRNWRIVKVATTKAQRKLFFNLRRTRQRLGWLGRDEVEDVARELGVSPEEVVEMEQRLNAHDDSFDVLPENDDDISAPANRIEDLRFEPERQLAEHQDAALRSRALARSLAELDARSRDIVTRRWLSEDSAKATLQELADRYGVSAERIRQLEKTALEKLRAALGPRLLPAAAA